jgi:hypothetical protein
VPFPYPGRCAALTAKGGTGSARERARLAEGVRTQNQRLLLNAARDEHRRKVAAAEGHPEVVRDLDRQYAEQLEEVPPAQRQGGQQCGERAQRWGMAAQIRTLRASDLLFNVVGLDWQRLAEAHVPTRSAEDCRIQWISNDHPLIVHTDLSPCVTPPTAAAAAAAGLRSSHKGRDVERSARACKSWPSSTADGTGRRSRPSSTHTARHFNGAPLPPALVPAPPRAADLTGPGIVAV